MAWYNGFHDPPSTGEGDSIVAKRNKKNGGCIF
jgi:hypothetical protein